MILASGATITYYEYLFTITEEHSPTKLMYGWSKHGGATKGMVQKQTDTWYCQSCRKEYHRKTHSFMFPIFHREFGRICQSCVDLAIKEEMKTLFDLMKAFERDHWR